MKVRTGFVSNSSTSSFCVLGYSMDKEEFFDKAVKFSNMSENEIAIKRKNDPWHLAEELGAEFCGYGSIHTELVHEGETVLIGIDLEGINGIDEIVEKANKWKMELEEVKQKLDLKDEPAVISGAEVDY